MAQYEFWLTDDSGRKITLLKDISFATIAKATMGYGTIHVGMPFEEYKVRPIFLPDRRIDAWRSPAKGIQMRREGSFFLRKYNVYQRQDGVQIIEFFGRSPIDILRRQNVISYTVANNTKTDEIDDMMKEIVSQNFVSPQGTAPAGEFTVDGNESDGPIVSHSFLGQNVLDILNDLQDISFSLNKQAASNARIFFDVIEGSELAVGGFGYRFSTFKDIRGTDRTKGIIFSMENGNINAPSFYEDHLDSATIAMALNTNDFNVNGLVYSPDRYLSRWNDIDIAQQTSDPILANNTSKANQILYKGRPDISVNVKFIDSPGSGNQPVSLYGIQWDLGDLLPVRYAQRDMIVEVTNVYISVNEEGKDNIVGLSKLYSLTPDVYVPPPVYYLIVAGGGGSSGSGNASNGTGGGGAGGMKTGSILVGAGTYPVVVGTGGAGGGAGGGTGVSGNPSSWNGISTTGGGRSGTVISGSGVAGGSGGGGTSTAGGAGAGIVGEGNNGGACSGGLGGAGGGGKGGVGSTNSGGTGGAKGPGESSSISGAPVTYAEGGKGGSTGDGVGTAGVNGTGDGANGSGSNLAGSKGGDGIVILSYLTGVYSAIGGTITTSGGYTIHTFTINGNFIVS